MPRNVTVTFADGSTHLYQGVPDDASPQQVEARAVQESGGKRVTKLDGGTAAAPPAARQPFDRAAFEAQQRTEAAQHQSSNRRELATDVAKSTGDTALSLITGAIATPLAGLAGIAGSVLPGKQGQGASWVEGVQNAMTWKPRSMAGQQTQEAIAKPLGWVADKADAAGQGVGDVTGSPLLATATTTALQGAPAFLAPEVRGAFSSVATSAAKGGAAAARGVGTAARATTSAVDAAKAAAAQAKAKSYVAGNPGLGNWDSLGDSVRSRLTQIAQDGGDLSQLDAAALAREAKFQSLDVPVPATRGTITRDPAAMRREANAAATAEGAPIAAIQSDANRALIQNLDVLKGKVSGTGATAATATNPEGAGAAVQGAARGKLELQKAKVKSLYEKADQAGETLQPVDATGVLGTVGDTIDQPHYGYAQSWLKANAPKIDAGTLTIRDLEKLRKQAVAKAMNGGEDGFYAGELIKSIDAATDGAGGDLYKAARAARRAQGLEFEEQGAVADLVSSASRTDRTTALENTVKAVTGQGTSLEDIRNIKRTLLTGGDTTTRTAGRQAWREVRAQVIQKIKEDATKGVATLPDGSPNLQPGALKSAIDRLGPDKLDEVFGPGTTKQLYKILEVTQDAKTIPTTGGPAVGSSTMQNVLTFLSKGIDKVPVVGKTTTNVVKGISKLGEIGAASREAATAATTPLSEVAKKAAGKARRTKIIGNTNDAAPLVPLSSMYSQKEAAR